MSKGGQLVKNTLIIAVGKLSTQFLTFFLLPVYTIFLSPTGFGQVDLIMIYISLLAPSITAQMEMAVFRHLLDARSKAVEVHRVIASSSLVLFVGSFIGAIGILMLGFFIDIIYIFYVIGLFLSIVVVGYLLQVARGLGRTDLFSIASIVTGLTNIALTCLTLIVFELGVEGVLISGILANFAGSGFLIISTKYISSLKFGYISKSEIAALLNYSWPLIPNHISYWGINGVSRTIIVSAIGVASVGVYAAASRFSLIYSALYAIFLMSWTEAVSLHMKNNKDNFISDMTDSAIRFFGALSLLIISSVALLFPLFVSYDFAEARQYVPLLILGTFISSIAMHYGAIYLAVRKTKQVAMITLQAMIISSVLTVFMIGPMGLYAPAVSIILTYTYLALRRHLDVQKYVRIKYRKSTFPMLFLFGIIATSLYYIEVWYMSVLGVTVSLIGFYLLNRSSLVSIKKAMISRAGTRKIL